MKNVTYIARLAITLLLITGIMAFALAGVNEITAPRIAENNARKTQEAVSEVLEGGGEPILEFTDETGLVNAVYGSDTGYAVEVAPMGFNGAVTMMVGINKDGQVLGISIISHSETPSLGAVAGSDTSAGERFRSQFAGNSGSVTVGTEIEAITSATITSKAVCTGVNAALACVANFG